MIREFIKKPVVVEAVQWMGDNIDEVKEFLGDAFHSFRYGGIRIKTLEGDVATADRSDWVVKGFGEQGAFFWAVTTEYLNEFYDQV